MSLINEYRATEEAIKELQARLANLSQDDKLKKELEFEGKLRTLMGEYSVAARRDCPARPRVETEQGTSWCGQDYRHQACTQGQAIQEPAQQ